MTTQVNYVFTSRHINCDINKIIIIKCFVSSDRHSKGHFNLYKFWIISKFNQFGKTKHVYILLIKKRIIIIT